MLLALVAVAGAWLLAASRIYVNASWSDDAWGYFVVPMNWTGVRPPGLGDLVVFEPPEALGAKAPYLKTVRGMPGAEILVDGDRWIWIDGERLGRAKPAALDGRPLVAVPEGVIPPGHYYLHADHADSHDSRYAEIGLVPRNRIVGRAARMRDLAWLGLQGPLVGPESCGRQSGAAVRDMGGVSVRRLADLPAGRVIAAVWLAGLLDSAGPVTAKDLGVWGEVWPIEEPDLLTELDGRLLELERSGELSRLQDSAKARARERLEAPAAVPGIAPALASRTWLHDPAIVVEGDVLGPGGVVIAAAGTRIEPLAHRPLTAELLFIDGTRPVEVEWALARVAPTRIILLSGRPLDLARAHGRAFYFDQTGALTERFGLKATPTRIRQEGLKLRITEIPLHDNTLPEIVFNLEAVP